MGLKKSLESIVLNRSNSYQFYKKFYDEHKDSSSNPDLEKELKKLRKDFNDYKNKTEEYIESSTYLFTTLFVDYELNEPIGILKNLQALNKQLLIFVDNICKKYDLQWWVTAGTQLGAVRHQNFVPWDDDIDMILMRKDYMKLYKVIKSEIEDAGLDDIIRLHYRHRKIDGETINSFIQLSVRHPIDIRKKPVLARLDIFPFDFIKDYDKDTIVDDHFNAKIHYFRNLKNEMDIDLAVEKMYDELNLSMEPTDYIIPGVEGSYGKNNYSKLIILDTDEIFPLQKVKFGDITVNIPKNPDHYLKKAFNKYLTLPRNVIRHSFIDTFRYSQDAGEVFEMCNNRIKDANDKF